MSEELNEEVKEVSEEVDEIVIPSKEEMLAAIAGEELPEPELQDPIDEPQYTDAEQEAISKGWNPEGVEGKRHKTAEEFLDIAPVYDRLHASEKKIKDMEAGFEHMREMQAAQVERAKEQAIKDLKEQMKEAVSLGDTDAAEKLADQMLETKETPVEPVPAPTDTPQYDPSFTAFVEKNTWYDPSSDNYDVDKAMYANQLGDAYRPLIESGKITVSKMLDEVNEKVGAKFKPTNPKRDKAAPVASSTPVRKTDGKKTTIKDLNLSQEEYRIVRNMIGAGQMTEEEYVQDYIKAYG